MVRLALVLALAGLALPAVANAALKAPQGDRGDVISGAAAAGPDAPICVAPDMQYMPDFIRDRDGTIVGINYRIVEYAC